MKVLHIIIFISISKLLAAQSQFNYPPQDIYNSTARIVCEKYTTKDSKPDTLYGTGTGFFFNFSKRRDTKDSTQFLAVPCLVTNKHVVEEYENGTFYFTLETANKKADYGNFIPVRFTRKDWIFHPDTSVDLCVLKLGPVLNALKAKGTNIHYYPLDYSLIPSEAAWDSLENLEDILIIGYPKGMWDKKNNLPISRKGMTATPLSRNFEGTPQFLIDAPIFNGSSGSPVFIYNRGAFVDTDSELKIGVRIYLIGIAYSMYTYNQEGVAKVIDIPTEIDPVKIETKIPLNLGRVIKASELHEFEMMFNK